MIKFTSLLSLQHGESALMLASEKGYTEIVKHLVEAKVSLDLQTRVIWPSNPYFYIALCSHDKEYYTLLFLLIHIPYILISHCMLIRCVMWYDQTHVTLSSISNCRYRLDIKFLIPYIRMVQTYSHEKGILYTIVLFIQIHC